MSLRKEFDKLEHRVLFDDFSTASTYTCGHKEGIRLALREIAKLNGRLSAIERHLGIETYKRGPDDTHYAKEVTK